MREKKILFVDYGGLGDHLQFSTLPEAFDKQGFDTYISDKSLFRSKETYDLVWGNNPFVKGYSNEAPNCGHINSYIQPAPGESMNRNWEIIFGADNNSNYPIIYKEPNTLDEYKGSLVIDLNGFSQPNIYNFSIIKERIDEIISQNEFSNIYFIIPNGINYSKSTNIINIENSINISISNIFEYCDIINSCSRFISIWSGGSHLSSAIKNKFNKELITNCFCDNTNKSFYWYDNVDYIQGAMTGGLYR